METVKEPKVIFSGASLSWKLIEKLIRTIGDVKGLFEDKKSLNEQDQNQIAYEVESYFPVQEGTEGGLFFGITHLQPGTIGNEYMMTKGHSHTIGNRAEFYWCIEG